MKPRLLAAAAVLAVCAAVYAPVLEADFAYDDHIYVEENAFVQTPSNLRYLLDPRYYLADQGVLAGSRPVLLASLMADRAVWGGRPAGYHLTNLILHGTAALCVLALGGALGLGLAGATLAGLLFAVHPLLSEAVCGISQRADILALLPAFGAVALLRGASAAPRRAFLARSAGAAALMLLSLLAKESAALVWVLGLAGWRGALRRRLAVALAFMAAAGGLFAAFRAPRFRYELVVAPPEARLLEAAARITPPEAPRWSYPPSPPPWGEIYVDPWVRLWTMSAETGRSLARLVVPGRPTIDRAPTVLLTWKSAPVLAAWLLVAAMALAAFLLRRAAPPASAGLLWALAAIVPVCGIAPLYNPVADRYLYVPMAGAAWALAALFEAASRQPRWGRLAVPAAALLLLPWAAAARVRAREWSSDKTLFFAAPGARQSPRAAYNRALVLLGEGRAAEAEAELKRAVREHPPFAEAWAKLGALHEALGDLDAARQAFSAGAAQPGPSPLPSFAFARFLARRGEAEAAAALYRVALSRDPGFAPASEGLSALGPARPKR